MTLHRLLLHLALAALTGIAGCGERSPARNAGGETQKAATRLPPLPEAFDSTGCGLIGAVYRPHPSLRDDRLDQRLRFELYDAPEFYDWRAVFEARDRGTGALVTSLRLGHTTSNGLVNDFLVSTRGYHSVQMERLNRDVGPRMVGQTPGELAPYAILLVDLVREIWYLQGDWSRLAPDVTFHTPEQVKPFFFNVWILSECGPSPAAARDRRSNPGEQRGEGAS
jgi:hypothetical protein